MGRRRPATRRSNARANRAQLTFRQRVGHQVEAPSQVSTLRHRHQRPPAQRPLASATKPRIGKFAPPLRNAAPPRSVRSSRNAERSTPISLEVPVRFSRARAPTPRTAAQARSVPVCRPGSNGLSSTASAGGVFSRRFSSSSPFSRDDPDGFSPPYFALRLSRLWSPIPCFRHNAVAERHASCSFGIPQTCPSRTRARQIALCSSTAPTYPSLKLREAPHYECVGSQQMIATDGVHTRSQQSLLLRSLVIRGKLHTSSRSRSGASTASLMRTRAPTASRPSMMRWS